MIGHILGLDDPAGGWYLFWSGIAGANIPVVFGGLIWWRHHNCHTPGCWRLGKHPINGTPYVVCRLHHPVLTDRKTD